MDIVRDIFTAENASIIMNIHLSKLQIPDKLIWRDLETCAFTVKSTYVQAKKVLEKVVNFDAQRQMVWKTIWKATISLKIKFFA